MLESELFGYERGAFTGATQSRKGLLEQAEGGTIFLDEITEIPLEAQAKLLRTIETRELLPLGGTKYRTIDVRFIAATNSEIKPRVERGEFRRDLYYRLSIYVYTIPPLRERLQDIAPLVRHFLAEAGGSARLSPAVLELFLCYPWPGNVRELKNVITYALARANGQTIGIEHLPEHITARCHRPDVLLGTRLDEKTACFEARLLAEMIEHYPEPKEAASRLGLGLRTFYRKLKKYGLTLRRP